MNNKSTEFAAVGLAFSKGLKGMNKSRIDGGYSDKTPAAIVYKATWEDEKIIRTTVGGLAQSAAQNGINKTALIIVGEFLNKAGARSKLYDPSFTHEYRKGTEK